MANEEKKFELEQESLQKGDFLQSSYWNDFQQAIGRKTFKLENEGMFASIIEHMLPIVGKYFYIPRGPVISRKTQNSMQEMIDLAKKENAGWIRIEPKNDHFLNLIKENISEKIVKAPHDMQPKEIFVLDISKSDEQLLTEMKPKTRYNINLSKKKNVKVEIGSTSDVEDFLELTKEMAIRNGISTHPENYYRKMIEKIPDEILKIYVAKYEGEIIAANLVVFYEGVATYLHGASGNEHRNLMAPFLLQWRAILDAKEKGCTRYDFGGVKTLISTEKKGIMQNTWEGITNFKLGFSPETKPVEFPGSYDIIINPRKYAVYRGLQRAKSFAVKFRR